MRLYLDMCSIQRPLDTKSQVRIAMEAEAVVSLLAMCEQGELELVASPALFFEAGRNPHPARREFALGVLAQARVMVGPEPEIEMKARFLERIGIKPLDALHLASAEAALADFFCTCDDRLLKRARALPLGSTNVVSPLELITEVMK
ncbi:MAG TPA: PIN domain-containing protein [Thermoanaerobaculia bacterium]|nr:PIN domain-containing protein [Thermoanaerobaculia bacterium]